MSATKTTAIPKQGNLLTVTALGNDWKDNEDLRLNVVACRGHGINWQDILIISRGTTLKI